MRKGIIVVLAAALMASVLAIASGCGSSAGAVSELGADRFAQINNGMTTNQVKAIAGDPARTETKDAGGSMPGMQMNGSKMDYWYYQGSNGWVRIEIADGKVTSKSGY